jgi:hypothetical protein
MREENWSQNELSAAYQCDEYEFVKLKVSEDQKGEIRWNGERELVGEKVWEWGQIFLSLITISITSCPHF